MFPRTLGNRSSMFLFAGVFAVIFTAMTWTSAKAQDEQGIMDEKAITVLKSMSDYLGASETISFRARTFFDVVRESGIKIKSGRASSVSLKRPKYLNIEAEGDDGSGATIWYDGSKLTIWRRDWNNVMSLDISGTTDEMLNHLIDEYDAQIPLADFFYSDISKTFKEDLLSAEYIGVRLVDGVECHQLSFESPGVDWQIWIEADATPVPRRFVMDFVDEENRPQYMVQMSGWSIGGELEDYKFVAAFPDSVHQVDFKFGQ